MEKVTGLFDFLKKRREPVWERGDSLPQLCYEIAYFLFPALLYGDDPARFLESFTGPDAPVGPGSYNIVCQKRGITPSEEALRRFHTHTGELRPGTNYYVLEYPVPPPVNLSKRDFVLAPYFSANLHSPEKGGFGYFILGQSMMGGTTLRTVTADGTNANMGGGPAPTLEGFLDALRTVVHA